MGADSYYSHGFVIPFISGFLIWRRRNELKETEVQFSYWGLLMVIASALIHIVGTVIYVFSVSGLSIFLWILGTSLFLFGKPITRMIVFPLAFLIFMFPLPQAFIGAISFPMKVLVSKLGAWTISCLGISVLREGFHITIPAGTLLVGNPCSGLRSLISFFALGSIYAYLSDLSNFKKWLLFFLTIPIALLSNAIRVPILILLLHFWGPTASAPDSFWHDASGVAVFIVGLSLLFCMGRFLEWKS
jgi:exosortase